MSLPSKTISIFIKLKKYKDMIKTIRKDFRYFIDFIKDGFYYHRFSLKLKTAIQLAILKQNAFNRAYYVILDHEDNPKPFSKREIRNMQNKGFIHPMLPFYEIKSRALYYTSAETKQKMTKEERKQKREDYIKYMMKVSKNKNKERK